MTELGLLRFFSRDGNAATSRSTGTNANVRSQLVLPPNAVLPEHITADTRSEAPPAYVSPRGIEQPDTSVSRPLVRQNAQRGFFVENDSDRGVASPPHIRPALKGHAGTREPQHDKKVHFSRQLDKTEHVPTKHVLQTATGFAKAKEPVNEDFNGISWSTRKITLETADGSIGDEHGINVPITAHTNLDAKKKKQPYTVTVESKDKNKLVALASANGFGFMDICGGWENLTQHARDAMAALSDRMSSMSSCCDEPDSPTNIDEADENVSPTGSELLASVLPQLSAGAQRIEKHVMDVRKTAEEALVSVNGQRREWNNLKNNPLFKNRSPDFQNQVERAINTAQKDADTVFDSLRKIQEMQKNAHSPDPSDDDIKACAALMEDANVAASRCGNARTAVSMLILSRK